MVTIGLWLGGAGLVALSLESGGAATVLFVIAALLIRFA
jgi:hypothetical protein